jgi:hypothetical protein
VKLVYAEASGITVYGSKTTRFAYAASNTLQDGLALPGSWKVDGAGAGRLHRCAFMRPIMPGRWRSRDATWPSRSSSVRLRIRARRT